MAYRNTVLARAHIHWSSSRPWSTRLAREAGRARRRWRERHSAQAIRNTFGDGRRSRSSAARSTRAVTFIERRAPTFAPRDQEGAPSGLKDQERLLRNLVRRLWSMRNRASRAASWRRHLDEILIRLIRPRPDRRANSGLLARQHQGRRGVARCARSPATSRWRTRSVNDRRRRWRPRKPPSPQGHRQLPTDPNSGRQWKPS